jgi:trans-2,3-dihydro-3-hydroxyanthranilate isomerase
MMGRRTFSYVLVDVFAEKALEGNQLAVFMDGRGLSESEMQAIAREMNLSETTFILPSGSEDDDKGIRVRIFTVNEELPFAGHPTLGTAYCIHSQTRSEQVVLNLNVGSVPVTFTPSGTRSFGEMRQRDPEFGENYSREELARAIGLQIEDVAADVPVQVVSTGMPFAIVPIRSLEVIQRMRISWTAIAEFLERRQAKFLYFVTRETVEPGSTLHARMIFYGGEDPATGSAAGCCTGWAVNNGVLAPEQRGIIEQGFEISRPSRIHIRGSKEKDAINNIRVGGYCVEVARGEFYLPK